MKDRAFSQGLLCILQDPLKPGSSIVVVTPVWNDSARLAGFGAALARALAAAALPVRWVIADDGSAAAERGRLESLRAAFAEIYPQVELHFAATHAGKGAVVRDGWSLAPDAGWLAFVDADGAVTAQDFLGLITQALAADQSVIGVRMRTATTHVEESVFRGLTHRLYLAAARWMLGFACADLQCGAKILKGADYQTVAARLCEPGLAFDSELLGTLHHSGAGWLEVPVNWTQIAGSKVHPWRDAWGVLRALWRVRRRLAG